MQKVVGSSPIIRSLESPGNGVFLLGHQTAFRLYRRGVQHFYEEHFACFVGDGLFGSADVSTLDLLPELQQRYQVRDVLYIAASTDSDRDRHR